MHPSVHALLDGIVDYAGTFPPAGLALPDAMAEYARARQGDDAWLLGRMVVPASGLPEFERLAPTVLPHHQAAPWPLNLILTPESAAPLGTIRAFNERWSGRARIAAVEFAPVPADRIAALVNDLPRDVEAFFEAPPDADLDRRLSAIHAAGAAAKIRTGGVSAAAFPAAPDLVRFLTRAEKAGVRFKATAGLHHPLRGCYPLTYDAASDTGTMYGFLNLAVAAALARTGSPDDVLNALLESAPDAFVFGADGLFWRGRLITTGDLAATRRRFFRSFGSCAFREPADDIRHFVDPRPTTDDRRHPRSGPAKLG